MLEIRVRILRRREATRCNLWLNLAQLTRYNSAYVIVQQVMIMLHGTATLEQALKAEVDRCRQ